MKVLLCGGGTGGHVYPLLAVFETLKAREGKALQTLYLGSQEGLEREIITRAEIPFQAIAAAGLVGTPLWKVPGQVLRILGGTIEARRIIRNFRPQAILATGGFVSVPAVLGGWMQGIPTLLYLPDIEPGLAVRFLAPFAQRIAISFPQSRNYFASGKTVLTGYPLRQEIAKQGKSASRRAWGISREAKVLLVLGGSRGAQAINFAVSRALPELLTNCVVMHISGQADFAWLQKVKVSLPDKLQGSYHLFAYLFQEMPQALAAADLALARAGASVLGEFPATGLPSILIPYPYARRHQERNAQYLAERGASLVLDEKELQEKLPSLVKGLLQDDAALSSMAEQARTLAQPQAAEKLAEELLRLIPPGGNN